MAARDAVGNDKIQRIDARDHQGDEHGGFHGFPTAQAGQVPEKAYISMAYMQKVRAVICITITVLILQIYRSWIQCTMF